MKPNSKVAYSPPRDFFLQSKDTCLSDFTLITQETNMEEFHGLPGAEFEYPYTEKPKNEYSRDKEKDLVNSTVYGQQPYLEWHQMHPMAYQHSRIQNSYQASPGNDERVQSGIPIREPVDGFVHDHNWPDSYGSEVFAPNRTETKFVSEYLTDSLQQNETDPSSGFDGLENFVHNSQADPRRLSFSQSPTKGDQTSSDSSSSFKDGPALGDTSSSRTSDDDKVDAGDGDSSINQGRASNATYAKLIYKALMEAPNHSMVLQDIYKWFIDNTAKGGSTSTGWRNSIRHNLSMNAAFRKTSRKMDGSNSKRTSQWMLEPFAMIEGVTPTTRYRKNGKKAYKTRNSGTRSRAGKSVCITDESAKFQSLRLADLHQDITDNGQYHTPVRQCTPDMENPNLYPYTPDCHGLLFGSPYFPASSFSDGWEPSTDIKSFQMDDAAVVYMDEHDQCGNSYPQL